MLSITKNTNLKARIIMLVIIPILLVSITLSYYLIVTRIEDAKQVITNKGDLISKYLVVASEYALFTNNVSIMQNLISHSLSHPDVTKVVVYDKYRNVLTTSEKEWPLPKHLDYFTSLIRDVKPIVIVKPVYSSGFRVLDYEEESPETKLETEKRNVIGWVELQITKDSLTSKKIEIIQNSLLITLITLIVGIVLSLRTIGSVTRPILHLTNMVKEIKKGRYGIRVKEISTGELGTLEKGFNTMMTSLETSHNQLQSRIALATQELTATIDQLELNNAELALAQQKAERASHTKEEFLARMSHEIRTPMNAVMGYAKLLEKTKQTEEQMEHTRIINRACHQLLTVIDDVLNYSKIESGTIELENIEFDIQESMEDVVSMLSHAAHDKGLELVLLMYSDMPIAVKSDPVRINQILINLVNNAIKFTEQGSIVIHVENLEETLSDVTIKISVSDTGIGIDQKEVETLFNEFTQADSSITRRYGGTGLGLTIAKKLSEYMQGIIGVESQIGEGSKFWFTVKCQRATATLFENEYDSLKNQKILVFDSNPYSVRTLRNNYIRWNATVFTARKFDKVIQILSRQHTDTSKFNVIIIGLSQNEVGSDEILNKYLAIRSIYAGPILILVGIESYKLPDGILIDPAVTFHIKPIRRKSLLTVTHAILGNDRQAIVTKENSLLKDDYTQGKVVLVVEDNVFNQSLINALLKERQINSIVANNASEALSIINTTHIDLVLMDIHLPDMSGIEAAKRIISSKITKIAIPIIALTADVFIKDDTDFIESGINDCIIKPISEQRFWDVINTWISQSITNITDQGVRENSMLSSSVLINVDDEALTREIKSIIQRINDTDITSSLQLIAEEVHQLKGLIGYFSIHELSVWLKRMENGLMSKDEKLVRRTAKALLREAYNSTEMQEKETSLHLD